jgi:3'-5' exonuclease
MSPLIVDVECVGVENAADYMEPIEAPSNYKDPLKIDAYIKEATEKAIERCGLDPDLCRIVALGHGDVDGNDHVIICQDEAAEKQALEALWNRVVNIAGAVRSLVTFNGFGYDLPVLMRRSQLLGVEYPELNLDKYRSPHIDLMQRLTWRGVIKPHSLKFYASRFGLPVMDETDGSQIAELVKAGNWKAVEEHCLSDLQLTRFLAQKLRLISSAQSLVA